MSGTQTPATPQKLTPHQVAERWGVSPDLVRTHINTGHLRAIDVRRPWSKRPIYLVDVADLAAFEHSRALPPPEEPVE